MRIDPADQPSEADRVHAAARQSLSTHGVRLYRARTREADTGGWTDPWSWEVGVANPATRAVQVRHFHAEHSPMEKLSKAMVHRWPWLNDDPDDPQPAQQTEAETIEIGRTTYYGGPDRWIDWTDVPFHGPARALWPLEAMLGVTAATCAGSRDVRGDPCIRYLCDVVPGEVAAREEVTLIDPPESDDDSRALSADVCVEGCGLVRRIAWSPTTGKRFRPGLLPRLAARLDGNSAAPPTFDAGGRLWNVTEFWDYGCTVDIRAPTSLIDGSGMSARDIARHFWRMRRTFRQAHRRP